MTKRRKVQPKRILQSVILIVLCPLLTLLSTATAVFADTSVCPPGMSQLDCEALYGTWTSWVPRSLGCSSSDSNAGADSVTIDSQTEAAAQTAAQKAETGSTRVAYSLYDSSGKLVASYNGKGNTAPPETYGASITKAMILVAYLREVDSHAISQQQYTADQNDLTAMIEQSDDAASNRVFSHLSGAETAIKAVANDAGMGSSFKYDTSDPLYVLGQSQITAQGFAKFFSIINNLIPSAEQSFGLGLLSGISQQVGLLQANLPGKVYSKEGWKPEPGPTNPFGKEGAPYIVNQAAQFTGSGTTYGIAVTVYGTADQATGEGIIKNVVSTLVQPGGGQGTGQNGGSGVSTVDASGNNVKVAYEFFVANGFTPVQSAGIVGNLEQESNYQGVEVNPLAKNGPVFGIAQWNEDRLTQMRTVVTGMGGNPNSLGGQTGKPAGQLDFVLYELNHGYTSVRDYVKKQTGTTETALQNVVHDWNVNYERSGDVDTPRLNYAKAVLSQYGNTTVTGSGIENSDNSAGTCAQELSSVSPNCQGGGSGNAKILCEAKQFAGAYYKWGGGPHGQGGYTAFAAQCPANKVVQLSKGSTGQGPCSTDCSGLVSAALDMAFGQNLGWTVSTAGIMQGADADKWEKVPIANAQPGDIVTLNDNTGHVEVVDHVGKDKNGTTLVYTFGTRQTGTPASPGNPAPPSAWTFAFRWNGPGAGGGSITVN